MSEAREVLIEIPSRPAALRLGLEDAATVAAAIGLVRELCLDEGIVLGAELTLRRASGQQLEGRLRASEPPLEDGEVLALVGP